MIESFADEETEKIFQRACFTQITATIQKVARRKLLYLDDADDLNDLRAPPGNRLEALRGDHTGQFSIRINNQWRICFSWEAGKAQQVRIEDYHG